MKRRGHEGPKSKGSLSPLPLKDYNFGCTCSARILYFLTRCNIVTWMYHRFLSKFGFGTAEIESLSYVLICYHPIILTNEQNISNSLLATLHQMLRQDVILRVSVERVCGEFPRLRDARPARHPSHQKISNFLQILQFFGGLVLGCIKTKFWSNYAFDKFFQALQDLHSFAPLQTQHFSKTLVWKISTFREKTIKLLHMLQQSANLLNFCRNVWKFS